MAARRSTAKKATEDVAEKAADICRVCWPNGWPHQADSASCEHGEFVREPEAPAPEQASATDPAGDGKSAPEQDPEQPPAEDKTEA